MISYRVAGRLFNASGCNSQFAIFYFLFTNHHLPFTIYYSPFTIHSFQFAIDNWQLAISFPSCFSFQELRYFFRAENVRHYHTPTSLNFYVCIFPNKTGRHLCWIKTQRFFESDLPIDLDFSNCVLI